MMFTFPQKVACMYVPLVLLTGVASSRDLFTEDPQLRIELGMHTHYMNRISVDKECTRMVTGSYDKTARLWELPQPTDKSVTKPQLLQVFRPPFNPSTNNLNGNIYAVALDPNAELAAVTGWTPSVQKDRWTIYIFDTRSAQVIATIDDNPFRIMHLVFSLDGEYLAATMKSVYGMRVWRTSDWKEVGKDKEGYGDSYGAAFDKQGRLYTVAYSSDAHESGGKNDTFGYIRRYSCRSFILKGGKRICDRDNFKLDDTKSIADPMPYSVAVQPHGDRVAVGALRQPLVYLFRSSENGLERLKNARTEDMPRGVGIGKIGWSADGEYLFAGGDYENNNKNKKNYLIRAWDNEGNGKPNDFDGPTRTVSQIMPCGEYIAIGSLEPAIGLIDSTGTRKMWQSRVGIDMSQKQCLAVQTKQKQIGDLKVSEDGLRVSFGLGSGSTETIIFDAKELIMDYVSETNNGLNPADCTSLPITEWNEIETADEPPVNPLYAGKPIAPMLVQELSGAYEPQRHRFSNEEQWISLAIAHDKKNFVLGTAWRLRGYEVGKIEKPNWVNDKIPGEVWAVNISKNGKILVAAYEDGTIRWHRMSDGKELLALLVHTEDEPLSWITWTPKGYFHAEIGGEDLIGWHVNRGPKDAAGFFPVYNYRDHSRKDIVQRVLTELDEDKAIELAIETRSRKIEPLPEVIVHSSRAYKNFSGQDVELEYRVNVPLRLQKAKVDVQVLVNGHNRKHFKLNSDHFNKDQKLNIFPLPQRDVLVSLVARAALVGERDREGGASIPLKYVGTNSDEDQLPKLNGVVIGIGDNYGKTKEEGRLEYADDDANDFMAALNNQKNKAFSDVNIIPLINSEATKKSIWDALVSLQEKAELDPNSVTVVFYSGHGVIAKESVFYIMPGKLKIPDEPQYKRWSRDQYIDHVGMSQYDLFSLISLIPGPKLLFFDACRSGEVNDVDFVKMMRKPGRLSTFTYSSTASGDISWECEKEKNGCFTQAILEALNQGKAAYWFSPLETTTTEELDRYLRKNVPIYSRLASGREQHPSMLPSEKRLPPYTIARHADSH